jgi:hypothetical protein
MRWRGRSRRRALAIPQPGDLVIDGHVRARLLGLHLLDLDAHVVVGSARRARDTSPAVRTDGRTGVIAASEAGDRDALPLARAQRLLAEGSTVLAGARRIH